MCRTTRRMHVHPLLMVACLMRLSPLERGRKEGRTCAAIKSLAWAAASAPFVATLKIQPTKKNRIIHRFGFRQSNLPSVLFLAMCNLPLERNNQRRQGRLSSFPPFAQSKFDRRPTDDWRRFSVRAFTVAWQKFVLVLPELPPNLTCLTTTVRS